MRGSHSARRGCHPLNHGTGGGLLLRPGRGPRPSNFQAPLVRPPLQQWTPQIRRTSTRPIRASSGRARIRACNNMMCIRPLLGCSVSFPTEQATLSAWRRPASGYGKVGCSPLVPIDQPVRERHTQRSPRVRQQGSSWAGRKAGPYRTYGH